MPGFNDELKKLDELAPDARLRVEQALQRTLEAHLAGRSSRDAIAGPEAFSRSVFSKSNGTASLLRGEALDKLHELDDEAFQKFAKRLSELRSR